MTSILAAHSRPSFANDNGSFSASLDRPRERSAERRNFIGSAHTGKRCRSPMLGRGGAPQTSVRSLRNSSACGARSPSGAPLAALARTFTSWLSSRPGFLGPRVRRALPALACPSPAEAPHAPAVVPEGMMPKAARERSANPRAGAALAPLSGVPSRRRPRMSKVIVCNIISDDVKDSSPIKRRASSGSVSSNCMAPLLTLD